MSKTLSINFADIPSNDLEPGDYDAMISQVVVRQAEGKEYPYLNWEFEITTPEHVGRKAWMMTPLSPQGAWKTRDQFVALGYAEDALLDLEYDEETGIITSPEMGDIPVLIRVEENEYQGRKRSQVASIIESYDDFGDDDDDDDDDYDDTEEDADELDELDDDEFDDDDEPDVSEFDEEDEEEAETA